MDKELEVRLQFLEEAQEYLDTLEAVVLGLSATGVDPKKMDGALRAAHSIKGGAALMRFQLLSHNAHRIEDCFKILQARRPQVGEELENLLLSALDSIRQIIDLSRESREGKDPDEAAMAQPASPLFDQLQDILGELQPEDETTLASQESGHDLVKLFFESEVENNLLRLEEVLAQPGQPCLESELSVLAQELGGLGEMLQLNNFSSLCLSVTQYLEAYPAQVVQIATLALAKWRQAQALVLIGQPELMPSELDFQSPAISDTAALPPEADNPQPSELELLLAGFEEEPMEALLLVPETGPETVLELRPEPAPENWPELESLLFGVEPETTTEKIIEPSLTPKTEADLGIEALLIGLDLDLFQELETASPVQEPLAEVIPENEWADLDSLFAEFEGEMPTVQKAVEPLPVAAEAKVEATEIELAPEVREMDLLANLLDFDAEPVILEAAKAAPLAIPEPEELTSDASEDMGLGMLASIFDIGVESTPSEPITFEEEEIHLEVEAQFLEVFDIEAVAPVALPEISEVSPDLGIAAEHEIIHDLVAETVLEVEPSILLPEAAEVLPEVQPLVSEAEDAIPESSTIEAMLESAPSSVEVRTIQWSDLEAFIAASAKSSEVAKFESVQEALTLDEQPMVLVEASAIDLEPQALDNVVEHEIIETPVAEEILDAEQPTEDESNPWHEIAAFVSVPVIAAAAIPSTETEVDQEHAAEAEIEQPIVLEEVSVSEAPVYEISLEPIALEVAGEDELEDELIAEQAPEVIQLLEQPLPVLLLPEASAIDLAPQPLEVVAVEHEILETPDAEEILEAEQPAEDESNAWHEIAAFVSVPAVAEIASASPESEVDQECVAEAEPAPEAEVPLDPRAYVLEKSILPKKIESASSNSEANTVRIPAKRLDDLDDLCGDLTIERNGLALYLERLHNLVSGLNNRVRNLEQFNLRLRSAYDQKATQADMPTFGEQPSSTEENFDVLEMDRYSELHLVWQEVMESIVQIQEVTSDIDLTVRNADDTAAELNRTAKQLQSNIMYSRMRPLTDVVGRFPRAIRDLAKQFGKPATLKIQGGSTLIDRTVLGILGDPLMHLLRNAFDHGLEDAETRIARGKPAQGTIEIKAFYRGNETFIIVSDDGGGINLDKIREKAIRIGLDQAQLNKARPQDLLDLIFEPGFSTADQVTELSGRGVGMDVVRTNLQQVRGKITVNTQPGIGTTFTLSVPVTLSVGRVLLVESQNVMLAFPVDAIEQMALLEEEKDNNTDIFQWENYAVPKLALKEWLNFRGPVRKIETDDIAMMANPAMLILSQDNDLIGVPIERCWGEREVAIRQAEGPIPMPPGFSGCTILGTGQVVPLVSIPGLFAWIAQQKQAPAKANQPATSPVQNEQESILIIDDSINVRRFLAMTLEKAGYRVAQAKDGQDAIEQLTSGLVADAVICDIEMPRLDGFGFLAQVKANPALKDIPITMLTSRSGDKHRQLALRLGASEYFSKPFKEQDLLQALRQLIQSSNQSTQHTPTS
jgi:two-component system, chemotaxis family, sensor histidine kinase and response regulator PixL